MEKNRKAFSKKDFILLILSLMLFFYVVPIGINTLYEKTLTENNITVESNISTIEKMRKMREITKDKKIKLNSDDLDDFISLGLSLLIIFIITISGTSP